MASLKKSSRATKRVVLGRLRCKSAQSQKKKVANQQEPNPKSSTMMDKSVPPPNQKMVIGSGVAEQFSSSEFHPLIHELLNELTVINLCCFKVRDIAKRAGDNSILVKLHRMEKAVAGMTAQLEGYSRGEQKRRNPGQSKSRTHYKNVYPLFKRRGSR